ncbi:MAG TPA: hypothetical protein VF108_08320 [Actinomycetota bacterium]
MPERWERELRKLGGLEPNERSIRDRAGRGPSSDRKPRGNALVAGIVAGAVAVTGIAALWQLDRNPDGTGDTTVEPPTLVATFESGRMIVDQPDEQVQRVDTRIVYGDARDVGFTSTISQGAHVDWVGVEDLTRFVPGPTAGSQVRFEADGEGARVLIGRPADWPEFDRFTEIDRLPEEPGDYVLVFEATYVEGIARTARSVRIVAPGTMQLAVTTRGGDATADAYVDGARTDGFLSASWTGSEGSAEPAIPAFGPEDVVRLDAGSPIMLTTEMSHARGGFVGEHDLAALDAALTFTFSDMERAPSIEGEYLLALEVGWGTGEGSLGGSPAALFLFPIEIPEPSDPSPDHSPSPPPTSPDVVTVDIRRSSEETGDPEAIARLGDQEAPMCPDGWTLVGPDGTRNEVIFDCGQTDVFSAPVGTPIEVTGDFATLNVSAGVTGNRHPGTGEAVPPLEPGTIVTLGYEVTWEDGSEASFWLLLTVEETETAPEEPGIVVWIYGLGERSTEVPIITMTYGGKTKRGCTVEFDWILVDGTRVHEAAGGTGSLPVCSTDPLFRVPPRIPITVEVPTASEVFVTRTTTPFYGGPDGFGASVRWHGGGRGDFTVTFEVAGAPSDRDIELDCPEEDRIAFATPDGPRILPGGSAYIRGNMAGFQQTDVIEQMTREPGGSTEWDGTWQVVRGGSVIAAVEFGSLRGVACRGSGIGGV